MKNSLTAVLSVILSMSFIACGDDGRTVATDKAVAKKDVKVTTAAAKPTDEAKAGDVKTPTDSAKTPAGTEADVKIPTAPEAPATNDTAATSPTAPTTTKPVFDPAAVAILDRLEAAGEKYTTLQSNVVMNARSPLTGDDTTRTGSVAYQKGDTKNPSKFRITFQTLQQDDDPKMKEKIDYIFDGEFLTEDNYKLKTRTQYQLAAKGKKVEPLKIGQGPFPMPFGQKKTDMLKFFIPITRKTTSKDPKNTDYIKLIPNAKNKEAMNFIRLEMWIDKKTNLPVKIVTKSKNRDIRTVTFAKTKTTAKIDPKLFDVKKPSGFKLHIEKLK
ncbi:MAG: hypothetical protein KAR11_08280 [Phycisphaerae bacterium]|nr:hypothetical protein [Phycisphaerae bacterium]